MFLLLLSLLVRTVIAGVVDVSVGGDAAAVGGGGVDVSAVAVIASAVNI